MKQNDYIVANLLNPTFSNQDFKDILGMDLENTQLLPYSSYTSSQFITQNEAFKDENGNFNEQKFKNFYDATLNKFSQFEEDTPLLDNFEYSIFDTSRKAGDKVRDPNFKLTLISNPNKVSIGISGRNQIEASQFSNSELAQQSNVYDSKTGKYLDYSPNDIALTNNPIKWFKSLFDEPLVKATYKEDGIHIDPITKKEVKHKKGQLRLNNKGEYFYETLGDQSIIGKEVLHATDYLTVDGEGLNNYDFLDTDSLDKSVTGTIAKTALTVAPLFIGGPVSAIYSGFLIARELGKSAPMLYGMISSLLGSEEDSRLANTIAAYGEKFTTGTSEYAKQNAFAFENIANLVGDIATQWGQQKLIANSINKVRGGQKAIQVAQEKAANYYNIEKNSILQGYKAGKVKGMSPLEYIGNPETWTESALGKAAIKKFVDPVIKQTTKNARLGADASLAYMAIVSNTDVYASMLEHGASKRDAAAVALGSTLGMFSVDRFLGLGEVFFDELKNEAKIAFRNTIKKEADNLAKSFTEGLISNPELKQHAIKSGIQKGINFAKSVTSKFADDLKNHTTGFFGKAIGEGLEEVSEELVTDLSKQLYQLAGEFSPNFINTSGVTDVGAWENWAERYTMSLLGGALGGGLFYGVDIVQNGKFHRDTTKDELIYLVSNNKTNELLKELENWKDNGKLGSTVLSASKYEQTDNGNIVYLTAENEKDSQNTAVYNRLRESILQLENILNADKTNLSEDQLFDKLVLSEQRFINLKQFLQDQSYATKYQENFRILTRKLLDAESDLKTAYRTIDGTPNGALMTDNPSQEVANNPIRLQNIKEQEEKVKQLKTERDAFLRGDYSLPYTKKMLFAIDHYLNGAFISMTYDQWLSANKNKTIDQLSDAEKQTFKEEYLNYKNSKQKLDLDQAFEIFEEIEKVVSPHIQELQDNSARFKENSRVLQELFNEDGPIGQLQLISYDTKLEDETEEQFKNRYTQLDGEDEDSFNNRQQLRLQKVEKYNQEQLESIKNKIFDIINKAGGYIDPSTQRFIHSAISQMIGSRKDDKFKEVLDKFSRKSFIDLQIKAAIRQLKPDFSNYDEIKQNIVDIILQPYKTDLYNYNAINEPIISGFQNLFKDAGMEDTAITTTSIKALMQDIADNLETDRVFDFFNKIDRLDFYEELLKTPKEQLIDKLLSYDIEEESLLEKYFGEDSDNEVDEFEWQAFKNIFDVDDNLEVRLRTEEEIQDTAMKEAESYLNYANNQLQELQQWLDNDPVIELLNEVDQSVTLNNPIISLISNIGLAIDPQGRNIESFLTQLHQKFLNAESLSDFILSDNEQYSVNDAIQLLEMVKAYLYAAGTESSFSFPVGHNKVINEFANNHKDIYPNYKELPVLDQSVADMYMLEIDKYLRELDSAYGTSWTKISNINRANKVQKIIDTDNRYVKAKLEFLNVIKKNGKLTIEDQDYDLFQNFDTISDENEHIRLHRVEDLIYANIQKMLKRGVSIKDILEQSNILDGLRLDLVQNQTTSVLDEHIDYGKFTDYDKLIYFLTIAGVSSTEFNTFIEQEVNKSNSEENKDNKIVPLPTQEQISRLAFAQFKNPKLFEDAFAYIFKNDRRPILDHIVFIDGGAGVGKTRVVARNVVNFANVDDVWAIAPKDTQLKTLIASLGKGVGKTREQLFNLIMDPTTYQKLLDLMKGSELNTDLFTTTPVEDGSTTTAQRIDLSKIKFNTIPNLPKLIVIDEVTHFSGLELQILNEFAKQNGISIIALGDTNQNGFKGLSRNIQREKIIAIRSPKLNISLRDVNLQKAENLLKVTRILSSMSALEESDPAYRQKFDALAKLISSINLSVYNKEVINGDLITTSLTTEDTNKLSGTVAFVGDVNGATFKTLKQHNDNITELIALTPDEIQGQEFDYIVIDQNWNLDKSSDISTHDFLANLYTLMSRGREAAIFIDNGLSAIIGNNELSNSRELSPNLRDAAEMFIKAKLELLSKLPKTNFDEEEEESNDEELSVDENPIPVDDLEKEIQDNQNETQEKIGDNSEDIEQQLKDLILKSKDVPLRVYGSAHLAGLDKIDDEYVGVGLNEDLGIFLNNGEKVSNLDELVRKLLNIKSVILYDKDKSLLSSGVTSVVGNLNNLHYKIVVRPKRTTDRFVGFTGLQEEGNEGNRIDAINNLVYSVVAEFENSKGELCRITLGLLANPDSWDARTADVIARKQRYQQLINNLKTYYDRCSKENKECSLDIDPWFSGITHIRKTTRVGSEKKPISPISLESFRKTHPYTVISEPYIYVGDDISGISTKMRGHAVVFVSDDTTLNPDELMEAYIHQKELMTQEEGNDILHLNTKPSVRMINLSPVGISFSSFLSSRKRKMFQTKRTINGKTMFKMLPFEEYYSLGARMITALWNYRANLSRFIKAYEKFKQDNNLDDTAVTRIARYADLLHNAEEDIPENIPTATQEEIELLNKFNDSLASEVREFRIGGRTEGAQCYLRQLTRIKSDNSFYQNVEGTPVGIYITPEAAYKQFSIIDTLLSTTFGEFIKFKNSKGEDINIDTVITDKDGFSNSLSKIISHDFTGGEVTISDSDNNTIIYPETSAFTWFPITLINLYQSITQKQANEDLDFDEVSITADGTEHPINQLSIYRLLDDSYGEWIDRSLYDVLSLALHGTLTDPAKHGIRATDSYFKHGIFIDPMGAQVVGETSSGNAMFRKCLTDESLLTVNVEPDMPIFTVTLNQLEEAYDQKLNDEDKQVNIGKELEEEFNKILPNIPEEIVDDVKDLLTQVTDVASLQKKTEEIVNNYYQTIAIPKLFKNNANPESILNQSYLYIPTAHQNISIREYLETNYNISFDQATISLEDSTLLVLLPDVLHKVKFNYVTNSFSVESVKQSQSNEDPLKEVQNTINEFFQKNKEEMEIIQNENEDLYNSLIELSSYNTVEYIKNALTDLASTFYDYDVILDLSEEVAKTISKRNCKI